jgi:hypothetical protein
MFLHVRSVKASSEIKVEAATTALELGIYFTLCCSYLRIQRSYLCIVTTAMKDLQLEKQKVEYSHKEQENSVTAKEKVSSHLMPSNCFFTKHKLLKQTCFARFTTKLMSSTKNTQRKWKSYSTFIMTLSTQVPSLTLLDLYVVLHLRYTCSSHIIVNNYNKKLLDASKPNGIISASQSKSKLHETMKVN